MTPKPTFEVSKQGLAKLLERRGGKAFAITELVQNGWDQNVTRVDVRLHTRATGSWPTEGHLFELEVEDDDPDGFADISHAYTLFAESAKKNDPTKRGRFNLGEKFVIAICETAEITTTTGTVTFNNEQRFHSKAKRKAGSIFRGQLRLTADEVNEVERLVHALIPPEDIATTYNGEVIRGRTPVATFDTRLQTEWADDEGRLKRNLRKCTVEVFEPQDDEVPSLYELGIPVVETGDRWHVNIGQKVPLNMDRDNVTPAYLRAVRAEVLNATASLLSEDDGDATWITEALTDERVTPDAIGAALDARFGENRVVFDPSDIEANKRAAAAGYTVIAARSLPKGVAAVARSAGVLQAAGAVTPSPRAYEGADSIIRKVKPPEKWNADERNIVAYTEGLGPRLLGHAITVELVDDPKCMNFTATYSRAQRRLEYNTRTLGRRFFADGAGPRVDALAIHELAHDTSPDHLSEDYFEACCDLGAKLVQVALHEPEFIKGHQR